MSKNMEPETVVCMKESEKVERPKVKNYYKTVCRLILFSFIFVFLYFHFTITWRIRSDVELLRSEVDTLLLERSNFIASLEEIQDVFRTAFGDGSSEEEIEIIRQVPPGPKRVRRFVSEETRLNLVKNSTEGRSAEIVEKQTSEKPHASHVLDRYNQEIYICFMKEMMDSNPEYKEKLEKKCNHKRRHNRGNDHSCLLKDLMEDPGFSINCTNESRERQDYSEQYSEETSSEKIIWATQNPNGHHKHKKSRQKPVGKFIIETDATTATPILVRQSRTKPTQNSAAGSNKLSNSSPGKYFQQPNYQERIAGPKETVVVNKEEAKSGRLKNGHLSKDCKNDSCLLEVNGGSAELLEAERNQRRGDFDSFVAIHFFADTSAYKISGTYEGNGHKLIVDKIYKDWTTASWSDTLGMSEYFQMSEGFVTVKQPGIYLIYVQIYYSTTHEMNGYVVNKKRNQSFDTIAHCSETSSHSNKGRKPDTCSISTTVLLEADDKIFIQDLHYSRHVVLTPDRSYFGLILLKSFRNLRTGR